MHKMIIISILALSFSYLSCTHNNNDFSNIKVGMTYDEVESILNKPASITRGATQLYSNIDELSSSMLKRLDLDTTNIKNEPNRWITPREIRTIGNLIYVTWIYNKTKVDTFYLVLNNFKEVKDTTTSKIPYYYLGERIVSKSEYQASDGYEYRLNSEYHNKIVSKTAYELYKGYHVKLPTPKKIKKRIEYRLNKSVKSYEEKISAENIYYKVAYEYCVIFDASSGRVTNKGFFPFQIKIINKQ